MIIKGCHLIVSLLAKGGVTDVVISPGSRNSPLIAAFDAHPLITTHVVNDERSAAFVALGIASITSRCVALVCTSGTAMLNYAPALAEARARHIPLLVLTADRPKEMIGRNEQQTINQPGAYGVITKQSFGIDLRDNDRYIALNVDEAIGTCQSYPRGPVHLNIGIQDPALTADSLIFHDTEIIPVEYVTTSASLDRDTAIRLVNALSTPTKVMIIMGAMQPSHATNKTIARLSSFGNYVIIAESISNINARGSLHCADALLSYITNHDISLPCPDIIITCGAPIISAKIKHYVTQHNIEHWHVGNTPHLPDNFGTLTRYINCEPSLFLSQIVSLSRRSNIASDFHQAWYDIYVQYQATVSKIISATPWNDITAVTNLLASVPQDWNIFLSNGMTVRYAQLMYHKHHRQECNRGVSGIDGCTSTAIGGAATFPGTTLLITGDMSAAYDMNALFIPWVDARFKIAVIDNGGGDIFRHITATSGYERVEQYMASNPQVKFVELGKAAGYTVFEASDLPNMNKAVKQFLNCNSTPSMLVLHTQGADLHNFLKSL